MAVSEKDGNLHFDCLSGLSGLESVAAELDGLVAQLTQAGDRPWFYASSDWLVPWARHCCDGSEVFLFIARDNSGALVAALPMVKQKVRIGRRLTQALTILGWPATDNFEVPARDATAAFGLLHFAWSHARCEISGWTCWMLREIEDGGPTAAAIDRLHGASALPKPEVFSAGVSPTLDLQDFLAEGGDPRTKKQLYRITKFRRKLAKEGEVEVPFWRVGENELDQVWGNTVEVESRSWKGEGGDATALQGGSTTDMLREVWSRVVPKGTLACSEVRLNGRALASHWGYIDGNRFLSFYMAYDNDYRSYGLGSVMLEDMVQRGREIGLRWIDASRGNTAGTHILGQYGGPMRQQVQVVIPRRSAAGLWVRMHCKVRHVRAKRAETAMEKSSI